MLERMYQNFPIEQNCHEYVCSFTAHHRSCSCLLRIPHLGTQPSSFDSILLAFLINISILTLQLVTSLFLLLLDEETTLQELAHGVGQHIAGRLQINSCYFRQQKCSPQIFQTWIVCNLTGVPVFWGTGLFIVVCKSCVSSKQSAILRWECST